MGANTRQPFASLCTRPGATLHRPRGIFKYIFKKKALKITLNWSEQGERPIELKMNC